MIGEHLEAEPEPAVGRMLSVRVEVQDDLTVRMVHSDPHLGTAQPLLQVVPDGFLSVGMSLHAIFSWRAPGARRPAGTVPEVTAALQTPAAQRASR